MSDPTPLTTRLEALRGTLPGLADLATLAGLAVEVRALRGIAEEPQTSLAGLLAGLRGSTGATLEDIYAELGAQSLIIDDTRDKLAALNGQTTALYTLLDYTNRALGAQPYDSLELNTVSSVLWAIYQLLRQMDTSLAALAGGVAPFPVDRQWASAGVTTINTESGWRAYARWPDAPEGATVGTDGYTLTPSGDWTGWRAFVQTNSSAPWENDSPCPAQTWYSIAASGSVNWSVESGKNITVYLQAPNLAYLSLSPVLVDGFYRIEVPAAWRGGEPPSYIFRLLEGQTLDVSGAHSQGQAAIIWETGSSDVPKSGAVVSITGPKTGVQIVRDAQWGPYYCDARIRG